MSALPRDTTLRVAVFTAIICSIAAAIYTLAELEPAPIMSLLLAGAPLMAVILWLQRDAQRTGVGAVQDLGMFVWFAWPVVIPWYAFKSRGRRGWRLFLGLTALICCTYATAFAVPWLAYSVGLALWYFEVGG
jgi:hypothetical protein